MFCLETAVKLLTFSWVVYEDTAPPAAEKEVHVDIPDPKSKDLPQPVQPGEVKLLQPVSAQSALLISNSCGHRAILLPFIATLLLSASLAQEIVCRLHIQGGRLSLTESCSDLQGDAEKGDREHIRSVSLDSQKAAEPAELTKEELMIMALSFYDLQQTHIIHEKDPDTKVHRWLTHNLNIQMPQHRSFHDSGG